MAKKPPAGSQEDQLKSAKLTLEEFIAANTQAAKAIEEVTSQSSAFLNLTAESAANASKSIRDVGTGANDSSAGFLKLVGAMKKQASAQKDFNKAAGFKNNGDGKNNVLAQVAKSSKAARLGILALTGAYKLLGSAMKGISSIIGGVFSLIGSALGWIKTGIGAIFDFIGDMYEGLFELAKERLRIMVENRRAAEEIRDVFGDIQKGTGKAVLDLGTSLSSGTIAGLAATQVFESAADAIKYANEVASQSPEAFDMLQDQFRGAAGRDLVGLQKGLGLTTEQLGQLMSTSIATGESLKDMMTDITKYSSGLAKRFGVNQKLLSRQIGKALIDVKHFAGATKQQIAGAAVYAAKLGTSLEKITGVMDNFLTFDEAAENVSKLSQAFGVNLDTMKLLEAKTPDEMLDHIKKGFDAAGKSAENMNRQELAMLARTTGLDEATIRQTLSSKNQGAALDEVKDASKAVAQSMMTTGEAMKAVGKDIKQVVREIKMESKGFFGTFVDGIFDGIMRSTQMQKILNNMAEAMRRVFFAGQELGRLIVQNFPGLKRILNGIAEFFNPGDLAAMFQSFTGSFNKFFLDLKLVKEI